MYRPTFEEFTALAAGHTVVPVYRTLLGDTLTPVSAFARLADGDRAFLFESVVGGERLSRYSFLGAGPYRVFEAYGHRVRDFANGAWHESTHPDPLKLLQSFVEDVRGPNVPGLPRFCGGAVGYAGYDAVRYVERLPNAPPDDRGVPDLCFAFHDEMAVFDHITKTIFAVAHARVGADLPAAYAAACRRVDALVAKLAAPAADVPLKDVNPPPGPAKLPPSNVTRDEFLANVARAKEYILAGDAFQIVYSQRFAAPTAAAPFDVYRALRVINPSPFMFYLRAGAVTLVGASPEIMCRVEAGEMTVRPLAGTRGRGATPAADAALAEELLADPKERAEHIMLVDLARNDVGKVCELGSVRIPDLLAVEKYSHVMHLSSTVTGKLKPGLTAFDALRSALPAGTLSGAPKVRAMEIIDELEPHRRGPYGGAVGYFDYGGNMDTCIALRTMVMLDGVAYVQAGAGLVADSDPAGEYAETVSKAMGLLKALEVAETQL